MPTISGRMRCGPVCLNVCVCAVFLFCFFAVVVFLDASCRLLLFCHIFFPFRTPAGARSHKTEHTPDAAEETYEEDGVHMYAPYEKVMNPYGGLLLVSAEIKQNRAHVPSGKNNQRHSLLNNKRMLVCVCGLWECVFFVCPSDRRERMMGVIDGNRGLVRSAQWGYVRCIETSGWTKGIRTCI